jgi:transketolase
MGWHDVVGDAGRTVSLEHFGASADYQTIFREFGITSQAVASAARDSLADVRAGLDGLRPGGVQGTSAPSDGGTGDRP